MTMGDSIERCKELGLGGLNGSGGHRRGRLKRSRGYGMRVGVGGVGGG